MNSLITNESYDLSYQAQLARAELAAAGIESWLADETLVSMDWFISNAVGGIKLQVSRVVVVFRCSSCKAVIAFSGSQIGRIENCPRCSRYVDVPETSDQALDQELIQETLARFRDRENPGNKNAVANSLYWMEVTISIKDFWERAWQHLLALSSVLGLFGRGGSEPWSSPTRPTIFSSVSFGKKDTRSRVDVSIGNKIGEVFASRPSIRSLNPMNDA